MVKIIRRATIVLGGTLAVYSLLHIIGVVPDFKLERGPFGERLAESLPPMLYGLLVLMPCRMLTTRKRFLSYFIPLSVFTALTILLGASIMTLSVGDQRNPLALLIGLAILVIAIANLWACFEVYIKVKE